MIAPPAIKLMFIGAPKCGTTWLTNRLGQHPGLYMPRDEIHYYSRHFARGPKWYADQFADATDGQILGENSNSYLTEPAALDLIAKEQPRAKILVVLRDPIERAYSSYGMQIDRGRANGDIALYMDPARSPRPHILTNGLYADLLAPWYDRFHASEIMVCQFEDIRSRPIELVRAVFGFVGLDVNFMPTPSMSKQNARKESGVPGGLKRALWWARPIMNHPPIRGLVRGPIGRKVESLVSRRKEYPPLTRPIVAQLRDYYSADIERLKGLTGQSFSNWTIENSDLAF